MTRKQLEQYEKFKETVKEIECNHCKGVFDVSYLQFQTSRVKNEKNETMDVTFFVCPYCQTIYVTMIKDPKTKLLLTCCEQKQKKMDSYRRKRKEVPQQVMKEYFVARQRLLSYQEFLKARYEKFFHLEIKGSDRPLNDGENKKETK